MKMSEQNKNGSNLPVKKFKAGAVSASVWKNQITRKDGNEGTISSVSLQRAYKDKDEKWQHTGSLRIMDLPKAVLLLNKAYEYLSMNNSEGVLDEGGETSPSSSISCASCCPHCQNHIRQDFSGVKITA